MEKRNIVIVCGAEYSCTQKVQLHRAEKMQISTGIILIDILFLNKFISNLSLK